MYRSMTASASSFNLMHPGTSSSVMAMQPVPIVLNTAGSTALQLVRFMDTTSGHRCAICSSPAPLRYFAPDTFSRVKDVHMREIFFRHSSPVGVLARLTLRKLRHTAATSLTPESVTVVLERFRLSSRHINAAITLTARSLMPPHHDKSSTVNRLHVTPTARRPLSVTEFKRLSFSSSRLVHVRDRALQNTPK